MNVNVNVLVTRERERFFPYRQSFSGPAGERAYMEWTGVPAEAAATRRLAGEALPQYLWRQIIKSGLRFSVASPLSSTGQPFDW